MAFVDITAPSPETSSGNSAIDFAGLCNEIRTTIHECGTFDNAVKRVFQTYGIDPEGMEGRVISCEARFAIRKERQPGPTPHSMKTYIRYGWVLRARGISFDEAVKMVHAQYQIKLGSRASDVLRDRETWGINPVPATARAWNQESLIVPEVAPALSGS